MAGSHVFSVDAMSLPTSVQSPRRGWSKSKPMPIPFESGELMCFGAQAWLVGFTSLVLLHAVCYFLITWAPNKSGRITEMKRDPHLAAHALPQLLAFVYAAWLGVDGWLWHAPAADATTIASHVPGGERMACMMIGFQLYELSACVVAEVCACATMEPPVARPPPFFFCHTQAAPYRTSPKLTASSPVRCSAFAAHAPTRTSYLGTTQLHFCSPS